MMPADVVQVNDVVKNGNYAYATRYDNSSGNELDRLYIYDVSDPTSPSLLSYSDYSKIMMTTCT